MKKMYIILNIILFILVTVFCVLHFLYQSHPPEQILSNTPVNENIHVKDIFKTKKHFLTESQIAMISDNNLFLPTRGVDPASLKTSSGKPGRVIRRSQFELSGICKMGELKGAIIINKSSRSSGNKKHFYMVGDKIDNTPYRLQDINPQEESVTINMGNSRFELKLERNDPGSLNRRKRGEAAAKSAAKASQVKPIIRKQGTPGAQPGRTIIKKGVPGKPSTVMKIKTIEELKKIREAILKRMRERNSKIKK